MDEKRASDYLINELGVSRETLEKLQVFSVKLLEENSRQNLIGRVTVAHVMGRHILDSAQLSRFLPSSDRSVIDLGSGGGLPGIVLGILTGQPMLLVENRALRIDWLNRIIADLQLANLKVAPCRVELLSHEPASSITARAFAPLSRLFDCAFHLSNQATIWVLPTGRKAEEQLASIAATWHGNFRMEPSITDHESAIIIASDVRRKGARR